MPVYTFKCPVCGKEVEEKTKIDEQYTCTECQEICIKIPQKSSFVLKGSGWYKDGY